jgi:hypothetical protein
MWSFCHEISIYNPYFSFFFINHSHWVSVRSSWNLLIYLCSLTTQRTPTTTGQVCSGHSYTVGKDDTCKSIAEANSISYGTFLADNGIDQNCTTLKAGSEVCLSPSCALYKVVEGDTCKSILKGKGFYKNQLLSWNP